MSIRAALFDFGGVITTSPFESFNRYESERGLPRDLIRTLNSTNPDTNAWAKLERSDVSFDEFCALYEAEARVAGHELDARAVMACLSGELRPEMVVAVRKCRERLKTACLTNNFVRDAGSRNGSGHVAARGGDAMNEMFDIVIESSRVGVRKPDARFYTMACELLEIEPSEAVFVDDLGVNLKPARELGMTTIKFLDPAVALAELEAVVGFPLS